MGGVFVDFFHKCVDIYSTQDAMNQRNGNGIENKLNFARVFNI